MRAKLRRSLSLAAYASKAPAQLVEETDCIGLTHSAQESFSMAYRQLWMPQDTFGRCGRFVVVMSEALLGLAFDFADGHTCGYT